jgi:type I restriction enzyme S subunit
MSGRDISGLSAYEQYGQIAECLSSVDELMAAQARKVDALKTHKKGLMQQLFPREGETQPRLRFPEFQNAGEWEDKES